MKANELRIGNWVYLNNDSHINKYEITSINANGMLRVSVNGIYPPETTGITKISPVPLTEEWLLKSGLTTIYTGGTTKEYKIPSSVYGIWVYIYDEFIIFKFTVKGVEICGLKNVNDLQNLYFALTGEELKTIK